jgi:uncharacterized damage-inducible protein DinB
MAGNQTTLAPFYKGWDAYQDLLTGALSPLASEQLALQASPSLRPVWQLAAHIIAARVVWFRRILGEVSAELEAMVSWDDDGQPQRNAHELVTGLEASWRLIDDCLARWTPEDLDQPVATRHGPATRQWVLWHVIEHDLHHGGELFLTLGMHGLPTPDL